MNTILKHMKAHKGLTLFSILLAIVLGGAVLHYMSGAYASKTAPGSAKPPIPEVEVETLQAEDLRVWNTFSGRLRAVDYVEVRPRVGGTITQVLFKEGVIVKKGEPLFIIDPRPFEAEFASAQAALETAQSQTRLAQLELKRAKGLVKKNAISQSRYDAARNDYRVAVASINSAKARLKQASLDLEYAHIRAPVSGRISRAEITVGNVIQAGPNAPVLTTIVSNDQLYAEFDVDEQTYIKTRRQADKGTMPVELTLTNEPSVVYHGAIHSFDNQLNTTSGTIRARAIFPNKDGALVPGMFATVHLGSPGMQATLLISELAIRTDQDKKYVYVVTPEKKVSYREVRLGDSLKGRRVVLSGLSIGEQVLINSLQRVQPDMEVQPIETTEKG